LDHRTRAAGTLVPPRCLGRSSGTLSWSSLSDAPSDLASGGEDPEIRKRKSEKITRRETKSGPRHWKNYSDRIIWAVDNKRLERGHTKLSRAATPVLLSAIDSFVSAKVMVPRPLEQTLVEGSGQQPSNISLASYIKKSRNRLSQTVLALTWTGGEGIRNLILEVHVQDLPRAARRRAPLSQH
jgi:hypothetical protein